MSLVILERPENGIGFIRINRPEVMNALNNATREELVTKFEEAIADDEIRVIVITGNEKAFVAGADLKEFADLGTADWAFADARRMWKVIAACPKPIVAAVNGFALGGPEEFRPPNRNLREYRGRIIAEQRADRGWDGGKCHNIDGDKILDRVKRQVKC